jgi:hypothetical protein
LVAVVFLLAHDLAPDPNTAGKQQTAEGLSPESRASAPGCPLRSEELKRAEFFAEMIVYNIQQTVQRLSGAVQLARPKC